MWQVPSPGLVLSWVLPCLMSNRFPLPNTCPSLHQPGQSSLPELARLVRKPVCRGTSSILPWAATLRHSLYFCLSLTAQLEDDTPKNTSNQPFLEIITSCLISPKLSFQCHVPLLFLTLPLFPNPGLCTHSWLSFQPDANVPLTHVYIRHAMSTVSPLHTNLYVVNF